MKKVLITGASGFIGRFAIDSLLNKGYEVFAVYTNKIDHSIFPSKVNWLNCDLLNSYKTAELLSLVKPTHLLHLAWYTAHGKFWNAQENLDWVSASINLIKNFASNGGHRIVISGSCAEYDWDRQVENYSENEKTVNYSSLYGACKSSLNSVLKAFSKSVGISSAWGRIFYLLGPYENPNRLVPSVICSLLRNQKVKCSHGNQIRDFLYVQDVAEAFVSLLDSSVEGSVNIASGEGIKIKDIIMNIAKKLSREELVLMGSLPAAKNEPLKLVADVNRLSKELNWLPKSNLDDSICKTIDWWKQELSK